MQRDADPVRREAYLERERKAWDQKKELKQWKPVAELTPQDQRRRRCNRQAKRRSSEQHSRLQSVAQTPPQTPLHEPEPSRNA
jgi:hypothetical protein